MSKKKKKGHKKNTNYNKVKANKNILNNNLNGNSSIKGKTKRNFLAIIIIESICIAVLLILISIILQNNKVESIEEDKSIYLFLGDSITNQYDVDKYYPELNTINSGINGNTTDHILEDLKNRVFQHNPTDVILLIGTNQIQYDEVDDIVSDTIKIITKILEYNENINIYVESIYPVNDTIEGSLAIGKDNNKIKEVNEKMKQYCKNKGITYIDVYNDLLDENGNLDETYTKDGLHIKDEAYEIVTKGIKQAINNE